MRTPDPANTDLFGLPTRVSDSLSVYLRDEDDVHVSSGRSSTHVNRYETAVIERLEPRLMLTAVDLSIDGADWNEGTDLTLTAVADLTYDNTEFTDDFDRFEVRWGVGATRTYFPEDVDAISKDTTNHTVTVTDEGFSYGDNGSYGVSATAIYRGETETLTGGKVYHPIIGTDPNRVRFLMYGPGPLGERLSDNTHPGSSWIRESDADEHLVMIRNQSSAWTYYGGPESDSWYYFEPQEGDLILAKFYEYDGDVVDYLDQTGKEIGGFEFGYAEGTLMHTLDPAEGFTTFTFLDDQFTRNAPWGDEHTARDEVIIENSRPVIDEEGTRATVAPDGNWVYLDVSFFDAGVEDRHSVLVDWGDSSGVTEFSAWTGLTQDVPGAPWQDTDTGAAELAHRYVSDGNHDILVTVVDDEGFASRSYSLKSGDVEIGDVLPASLVQGAISDGHLLIRGTDAADDIHLTSENGTTRLFSHGSQLDSWSGVNSATIYGFGSDDSVRVSNVPDVILYGGDGDDTLLLTGTVNGWEMHGGPGDDVFLEDVAGHAGSALIRGGAGLDRYFVTDESLVDRASIQELAEKQVFTISGVVSLTSQGEGVGADGWSDDMKDAIETARATLPQEVGLNDWSVVYVPPGTYEFGVSDYRTEDIRNPLIKMGSHLALVGSGSQTVLTFTDEIQRDFLRRLVGTRHEIGENYGVFNLGLNGRALQTELMGGHNQYVDGMVWTSSYRRDANGDRGLISNVRMEKLTLEDFPGSGVSLHHGVRQVRIRDVRYSDCYYVGISHSGGSRDILIERTEQMQGADTTFRFGVHIEMSPTLPGTDEDRIENFVLRDSVLRGETSFLGISDRGSIDHIEGVRILDNQFDGTFIVSQTRGIEIRGNLVTSDALIPKEVDIVSSDWQQNLLRVYHVVDNVDIRGNTVIAKNGAYGGIVVSPNDDVYDSPARDVVIANNQIVTPNFGIIVKGGYGPRYGAFGDAIDYSEIRNVTVSGNDVQYDPDTASSGSSLVGVTQLHEIGTDGYNPVDTGPWVSTIFFSENSEAGYRYDTRALRANNVIDKMVIHFNDRVELVSGKTYTDALRIRNHRTNTYLTLPEVSLVPDYHYTYDKDAHPSFIDYSAGYDVSRRADPTFDDVGSVWVLQWDEPWNPGFYTVELIGDAIQAAEGGNEQLDGDVDWVPGVDFRYDLLLASVGDATLDGIVDQTDERWVNVMRETQRGPMFVDVDADPSIENYVAHFGMPYPHIPHVRLGPDDAFDTMGSFTLAFRADTFPTAGTGYMFRKADSNDVGWWMQGNVFTINDGVNGPISLELGDDLIPGEWHHVAILVDADNDLITAYLDGDTDTPLMSPVPSGYDYDAVGGDATRLLAGSSVRYSTKTDYSYDGRMDDVLVATRLLTLPEIADLVTNNTTPVTHGSEILVIGSSRRTGTIVESTGWEGTHTLLHVIGR